jgi:hypothetical protein
MGSIREPIIILIAFSTITVSLIVPFYSYSIFALSSNPCPKYCDGCCVTTKAKNATGLAAISPTNNNQKALMRNNDNGPTPPACPDKGPIPPDCTLKPKF